jgi:hypothetical protein
MTTQDAGNCGLPDEDQLAFARAQERVMVTFDPDYLVLHRSGSPHAGVAWCPEQKYRVGLLVQMLELLHGIADRDSMRNHLEYL